MKQAVKLHEVHRLASFHKPHSQPYVSNRVMKLLMFWLLLLCSVDAAGQDPYTNVYKEEAWKARDEWQKAEKIIALMQIGAGSQVADVGCHEGYMTVKLSKVTGVGGKVFAVDLNEERLERLKAHQLTNVVTVVGEKDDPHLPPDQLDAVLIVDAYHEMRDHVVILERIKTSLKAGGRIVICEPIADERRNWSRDQQAEKHEIAMKFVKDDLLDAGFRIVHSTDPFVDRRRIKGDVMWIIVGRK